jgi:hypothetical protein
MYFSKIAIRALHPPALIERTGLDGHVVFHKLPVGDYQVWAFDGDTAQIPWAEEQWMTQYAGIGEKATVTEGMPTSVTVVRKQIPEE